MLSMIGRMFPGGLVKGVESAVESMEQIRERIAPTEVSYVTRANWILFAVVIALILYVIYTRMRSSQTNLTNIIEERIYTPKIKTEFNFKNCSSEEVRGAIESVARYQKDMREISSLKRDESVKADR
jgi:hypothetical protein